MWSSWETRTEAIIFSGFEDNYLVIIPSKNWWLSGWSNAQ